MEVDVDDLDDSVEPENSNTTVHIQPIHEHNQDYKCDYCGKFFHKTSLKRHIHEVHEGREVPRKVPGNRGRKKFTRGPQDPNKKVRKWIYNPDWEEIPEFQGWLTKFQQTSEETVSCYLKEVPSTFCLNS